jgi:hypothetical protein
MFQRYAIFVTPQGRLAELGAAWLGWDMAKGCRVSHPYIDGLDIAKVTNRPRKYGLHATIKPPMRLADGTTEDELKRAAITMARGIAPIVLGGLKISRIGRFLALTPLGETNPLAQMANTVVEHLDPFRAPPSSEELARRRQRALTPSQESNLTQWGYPHVMKDFRFHITLTGPLKDAETAAPLIAAHFTPALPAPYVIDHLTLAGEDADGMFHSIARLPLGG